MLAAVSTPGHSRPSAKAPKPARRAAGGLILARALVVLAAILAVPAALAGYVRWQALDRPDRSIRRRSS
jgi:hypothetical protein